MADIQTEIIKRLNAIQAELDFLRSLDASGGSGTVTSVSGTLPISVATGTTTPVISIAVTVANDGGAVAKQTGAAAAQTGEAYLTNSTTTPTVEADNSNSTGKGVVGKHTAATGAGAGVYGETASSSGKAVYGKATASSGTVYGGYFDGDNTGGSGSTGSYGVYAIGEAYGVYGQGNSNAGLGGYFTNSGSNAVALKGEVASGSGSIGVQGTGVSHGVDGTTASNTGYGVYGNNTAGSDGAGAAAKFDGGTHTIGTIVTTNHATKEALQVVQSGAGPVLTGYNGATLTSEINTDGTANLYTSPNYVMNGDMLINQRFGPAGTLAIATGAQNKYMVDRWHLDKDGTSQGTLSQIAFTLGQTDVPNEPAYYLDWNHSTAGTGGTKDNIQHNIEGVRTLAGKQVTFSIYMKVAAGTQAVTLEIEQNFGSGGSPSASVLSTKGSTDTVTTTFQRFSYTVTLGSISGKTIGTTAFTDSLIVRVKNPLNAAYQISYAHAQLELGPIATPFRVEDFGSTLEKCKRYYQKTFTYTTVPAQAAGLVGAINFIEAIAGAVSQSTMPTFPLVPAMRVLPTGTFYNHLNANAFARNVIAGADCTATSVGGISSEKALSIAVTPTAAGAKGDQLIVHATLEADY